MRTLAPNILLLAALTAALSACAAPSAFSPAETQILQQHVVVVDPDGHPIDPVDNHTLLDDPTIPLDDPHSHFYTQVQGILAAIDANPTGKDPNRTRQILIYIHGDLNTLDEARGNAMRIANQLANGPDAADIFPIAIDWQSDFMSTYGEEMRFIRQGDKDKNPWGGFTAPLHVGANLGAGAAEAPIVWLNMAGEDTQTLIAALSGWNPSYQHDSLWDNPRLDNATQFFKRLNDRYLLDRQAGNNPPKAIAISVGKNYITPAEWALRGLSYTVTIPLKLETGPLINGLGKPAWENMCRRTATMFESPNAFITAGKTPAQIDKALDHGEAGAISYLLYELARKCEADYPAENPKDVPPALLQPASTTAPAHNPHYEITIVAHSMGSIVANNILSRFPHLPVKNIVYMGAACTINDMRRSVVPFMQEHKDAQFYNLCLHPVAETLDTEALDFVPRGSLLVWIDNFLENPRTPLDRTMGRWENIAEATYVFPEDLRGRIHIKSFDLLSMHATPAEIMANPQKHGDFSKSDFWVHTFWDPDLPIQPSENLYKQLDQKAKTLDLKAQSESPPK